jgi:hypothetical protein
MGAALGDIDFDQDLDWFITSISAISPDNTLNAICNRLFRNDEGSFVDVTDAGGVADGFWGWGACFLDLDNDTDLDVFHTNRWWDTGYGDDYRDETFDGSARLIWVERQGTFTCRPGTH